MPDRRLLPLSPRMTGVAVAAAARARALAIPVVAALAMAGCAGKGGDAGAGKRGGLAGESPDARPAAAAKPAPPKPPPPPLEPLGAGEVYAFEGDATKPRRTTADEATAAGLLVVDLSDGWAPFMFREDAGGKPAGYRRRFVELANEKLDPDGLKLERGKHNFLEPFGIPPTLSVVRTRMAEDLAPERIACAAAVDAEVLRTFKGYVGYQDRDRSRREHAEALRDADWIAEEAARQNAEAADPAAAGGGAGGGPAPSPAAAKPKADAAAIAAFVAGREDPATDPKVRARIERYLRGQERLRAVRAAQALLECEGLLSARSRYVPGMFDLQTHEALAVWERKNNIFGWGFLGDETAPALVRPPATLHLDTFHRVLAERVADAAGIVEDGSSTGKSKKPTTYRDGEKGDREAPVREVPNLIEDHVQALLAALGVGTPEDAVAFLARQGKKGLATLRVAFRGPALPPYYQAEMDLAVEIDRGDIWYDFPFDARGKPTQQVRQHFPQLTLFTLWRGQKIPLVRWRTTIGSWRSELHANGKVYFKYKNSDVGPRLWKNIVAGPVWVPPDGTPAKDLLTKKVLEKGKKPVVVVNTDVMGPGFQSAYGLVMAIHVSKRGHDNQIRTHGSVDYTSIARRFSHGCHRLVNNRAVRLFDFLLRHRPFKRMGDIPLGIKRKFTVDEEEYTYSIKTRGTYYELTPPLPVLVTEGRVMGKVKQAITAFVEKAGVDYSDVEDMASGDADASTSVFGAGLGGGGAGAGTGAGNAGNIIAAPVPPPAPPPPARRRPASARR